MPILAGAFTPFSRPLVGYSKIPSNMRSASATIPLSDQLSATWLPQARHAACHTCSFGSPSVTRSEDRQPLASRDDMRRHFTTTASCSCTSYY